MGPEVGLANSALTPGARVDRYVLEERLGASRLGEVWRVRHRTLGTTHALKVLTRPVAHLQERLLAEGRLMAGLAHPNAVACTDVLLVNGQPALLVDLVEGGTLLEWSATCGSPLADQLAVAAGVLLVLDAAHARGIVHRDIAPDNVLVETGPPARVRVADFGLAKALYDANDELTGTGSAIGVPSYTAPEQMRDAREVDGRADLFSFGCILYEMITGERAFPGSDAVAVMRAVQAGTYTPLPSVRPDLPPSVVTLVHGALEPDVDRRVSSAMQMHARLERAVADCRREGTSGAVRAERRPAPPSSAPLWLLGCLVVGVLGAAVTVVVVAAGLIVVGSW